jgi:hypothetical protein
VAGVGASFRTSASRRRGADQGSERRGAAERGLEGARRDGEGRDHDHDHDRELDHDRDRDRDHDRDRERAPTVGRRS